MCRANDSSFISIWYDLHLACTKQFNSVSSVFTNSKNIYGSIVTFDIFQTENQYSINAQRCIFFFFSYICSYSVFLFFLLTRIDSNGIAIAPAHIDFVAKRLSGILSLLNNEIAVWLSKIKLIGQQATRT